MVVPLETLEPVERALVNAALRGERFDLGHGEGKVVQVDGHLGYSGAWWESADDQQQADRRVRADVLAGLLAGGYGELPGPRVDIMGVNVLGDLQLADVTVARTVHFEECRFGGVDLSRTAVPGLGMFVCSVGHLEAVGLSVRHSLWLTYNLFRAGLRLSEASVGGSVELQGSIVEGWADPTERPGTISALEAERLVAGSLIGLSDTTFKGRVHIPYAEAGGWLHLGGAKVTGVPDSMPAVNARGMKAAEAVLTDARIDGSVDLSRARIASTVHWQPTPLGGRRPGADFSHAQIGDLADEPQAWVASGPVTLTGLRYDHIDVRMTVKDRLSWLPTGRAFTPQPYEQLARVYRAQGQEDAARRIAIAKQRERGRARRRDGGHAMNLGRRMWHRLFGFVLGFGYQPWRAAVLLAAVFLVCATAFGAAAHQGAIVPKDIKATAVAAQCTSDYPCFNQWMYAFDVTIPLISVGQDANWRPDAAGYLAMFWAGRILGWGFATLAVAALTGLVRKE